MVISIENELKPHFLPREWGFSLYPSELDEEIKRSSNARWVKIVFEYLTRRISRLYYERDGERNYSKGTN